VSRCSVCQRLWSKKIEYIDTCVSRRVACWIKCARSQLHWQCFYRSCKAVYNFMPSRTVGCKMTIISAILMTSPKRTTTWMLFVYLSTFNVLTVAFVWFRLWWTSFSTASYGVEPTDYNSSDCSLLCVFTSFKSATNKLPVEYSYVIFFRLTDLCNVICFHELSCQLAWLSKYMVSTQWCVLLDYCNLITVIY